MVQCWQLWHFWLVVSDEEVLFVCICMLRAAAGECVAIAHWACSGGCGSMVVLRLQLHAAAVGPLHVGVVHLRSLRS
jgi:hypothetical protein